VALTLTFVSNCFFFYLKMRGFESFGEANLGMVVFTDLKGEQILMGGSV
jgi:hypothetical protein